MIKVELIKPLSVAAILALGAPAAFAQENTDATEAPVAADAPAAETASEAAAAAEAPATGTPIEPSLGTEVTTPELQPGQAYLGEKHGDWEMKCLNNPDGQDPCLMSQLLKDGAGNSVADVSIERLPEGGKAVAVSSVAVPLETLLTQQLTMSVDGSKTRRYPFAFCTQQGCVAHIGFTAAEVASFKKGAKATITIVPAQAPDQKVNLDMSLTGFTAAFNALPLPVVPQ